MKSGDLWCRCTGRITQEWKAEVVQSHLSYFARFGSRRNELRRMPSEPVRPAPWAVCGGKSTSFDDRVYKRKSPALRLAARAAALWVNSHDFTKPPPAGRRHPTTAIVSTTNLP